MFRLAWIVPCVALVVIGVLALCGCFLYSVQLNNTMKVAVVSLAVFAEAACLVTYFVVNRRQRT